MLCLVLLLPTISVTSFECDPKDEAAECVALVSFAAATGCATEKCPQWTKGSKWLEKKTSICDWHGITCTSGFVTEIDLKNNGLTGSIPAAIRYALRHALLLPLFSHTHVGTRDYDHCFDTY